MDRKFTDKQCGKLDESSPFGDLILKIVTIGLLFKYSTHSFATLKDSSHPPYVACQFEAAARLPVCLSSVGTLSTLPTHLLNRAGGVGESVGKA